MATKIYDHITIDGDDAKLDASLIENLDNNEDFAALKEDLSDLKYRVEVLEHGGGGETWTNADEVNY